MEIKLNIVNPNDNTNTQHGSITLSTDNKFMYIESDNKRIAVYENDFYRAVCALHR